MHLSYRIGTVNGGQICDGVYPVFVNNKDEVVGIFKYPSGPRNPGTIEGIREELKLYAQAVELPTFDRETFGYWDYISVNGWEDEIVSDDKLNQMILAWAAQTGES